MIQFKTIYGKIKTLLISVGTIFLILFLILQVYKYKQDKEIFANAQERYQNEINGILNLKTEPFIQFVNDLTFWDEFVLCIETKDEDYFDANIASMINSFNVNSVYVFDKNFKQLFYAESPKQALLTPIPGEVVKDLHKTRFAHFFIKSGDKLIEVFAASVHLSDDPKHITEPKGYLFVQKEWNQQLVSQLSSITGSKIEINSSSITTNNSGSTLHIKELTGWDGKRVATISFSRELKLNLKTTSLILYIILAFVISALLVANIIARRCINKPLKLVTDILKTDDKGSIDELKKSQAEYGHIGRLFEHYVDQKIDLEDARIRAEKADKLKSAFLANISHEIRTPLSHIIGFTGLIEEEEDLHRRKEYIQIVKNSSLNLVNLIDDLIDLSKIEIGDLELKNSIFNLNSFMKEIETVYLNELKKRGKTNIRLSCYTPDNEHIVRSDPQRIKQILSNLLSNSVKFTENGIITFGYKVENENLIFSVSDTGVGIREENQRKIFDRFTKFDYNDMNIGGTGIGLSIVQKIISVFKGKIWFDSSFQVGTNFYFSIPVSLVKSQTETKNAINGIDNPQPERQDIQKNVLIVEDDLISLILIKEILNPLKLNITSVENGEKAIEHIKNYPDTDLILMDLRLPGIDGYEATSKIRELNKNIPIIAQTANAMLGDREKALRSGCTNYISKPIDKFKLLEMIKIYIFN